MPSHYERLPQSPTRREDASSLTSTSVFDLGEEEVSIGRPRAIIPSPAHVAFIHDPRFDLPTPPKWQRGALLFFIAFMFWLGYKLRGSPMDEGVPAIVE